ncbi:MAG TPA: hypothetical protein VM782_22795 [Stellaceae bacterium]|nr:hypothetical protein [Stellaceae bacterium]
MAQEQWQARIEGGLNAGFIQPDGSSRRGTDWVVGLKRGEETHKIFVRAYLAEGVSETTRDNTEYQGRTVIGFVFDRLAAGWSPVDAPLPALTLTILDPKPGQEVPGAPKRGFLGRLFGR